MHVEQPARVKRLAAELPVSFVAFDLLWLDGHSLMGLPLAERRELLEALDAATASTGRRPRSTPTGAALLAATERARPRGRRRQARSTRPTSPAAAAAPGSRSSRGRSAEFLVGGWLEGEGGRSGRIGALLVGEPDEDGALRYAGPRRHRLQRAAARRARGAARAARARRARRSRPRAAAPRAPARRALGRAAPDRRGVVHRALAGRRRFATRSGAACARMCRAMLVLRGRAPAQGQGARRDGPRRRARDPGHEPRQGPLSAGRLHQARRDRVLRARSRRCSCRTSPAAR